ncbi:guanylate-binding protein 1-like [Branchiostoma floridae]|uniref:Guanylate-binding protein 1-like n=1 Tax=Branchiostoma floridae TaxID=7739 RepID=A0A9J7HTJ5_BRAFL|nr:guanylate-binding protein 1-like [Branchiostoma floridae]
MSGLLSKFGFAVEELKPKKGGQPVHGSSIPLILPNDLKYNASTGAVEKIQDEQRATLHGVPQALELLEGIEEPVSVISICGPCRTGKSYILSRLLGTADAFALGHRMDPQTFGIWMGTKVLRGKDFTIVLLDTEGIDAISASAGQDASILVMTILLSSQLIYNSLNVPYKGDLEKLQCFVQLASGITVKKGKGQDVSAFREFFPDFLWLLRDVALKMEDDDGKEMTPTEYLVTKVLNGNPNAFEESKSDKVGRAILTFFPSVECAILVRPSGDTEVMKNIAQHKDNLIPEFNKGVDELTETLLLKARTKKGYDKASTVNGVALSIMTKGYLKAVNDPNAIPALDNTWQNTIEVMRGRAIEEVVAEYNKQMQAKVAEATKNGIPLEEDGPSPDKKQPSTLMDLHNAAFKDATAMFVEKVGHFGISSEKQGPQERNAVVDQMQKRLVQREERTVEFVAEDGIIQKKKGSFVTGGELHQYIQANKQHSWSFCQELFEYLFDPIRKHALSPPSGYDFKQLMKELDHARQQYNEQARGPEKWVVLKEMTKTIEKMKVDFEKIKGYQKEVLEEQQKVQAAEVKAKEQAREMQQLINQAKDREKAQQETLQKVLQQNKEQMETMKQQETERLRQEEKKVQELKDARREEQAQREKDRSEREHAKMMEVMMGMQQQQTEMNRHMLDMMGRVMEKTAAPPAPPPSKCPIS